jgi:effector-binding domain-containing protein
MPRDWVRLAAAGLLAILAVGGTSGVSRADNAPWSSAQSTPAPSPQTQPPSAAQPQTPAAPAPATSPQPPAASGATPPSEGESAKAPESGNGSTGNIVDLTQRPFAYIEGKADRDEVFSSIQGSLGLVRRDMDKAGVKPSGRPLAVFLESDDTGFRYRAGYPLESAPDGKSSLSDAVKIGLTPSGKAMRFQHLGAYADIDATYDAITAYLDEKGIDAQDSFIEEYANDVKDPDDPNLEVDIDVLLK